MSEDTVPDPADLRFMDEALRLARKGYGRTSPNPAVGAVLVRRGRIIGRGWHRQAGRPHAEIEALADARTRGETGRGATLYVTLEPCSTQGRTPPCTNALLAAGVRRVVVGAIDPNPAHQGRGLDQLRRAGLSLTVGVRAREVARLNEAFNHWIVHRTPFVTVKSAMSLDGKIATAAGESKWITSAPARAWAMKLRAVSDAILVGIRTVLLDDPGLTLRVPGPRTRPGRPQGDASAPPSPVRRPPLRRIILDARARTPLGARVASDQWASLTTIVVARDAPPARVQALARRVRLLEAPSREGRISLPWLLRKLGGEGITSLLVEGGGEVNASFLLQGLAHRIAFFYAPLIIGGAGAVKAVGGPGIRRLSDCLQLSDLRWRRLGPDLLLTARLTQAATESGPIPE